MESKYPLPNWQQALYYLRGPLYNYFNPLYDEPAGPSPKPFTPYGYLPPADPFRAREPVFNPIHGGLFNSYSKNMDSARPEFYDELVTLSQYDYDEESYDLLNAIRNGPKKKTESYYAHRSAGNTAKETDEYITGIPTQSSQTISNEARLWGSTLPTLLANYGIKNVLLTGGLIGGLGALGYGGYKAYNWWKNRNTEPEIKMDAGINVTSSELSNNLEHKRPTNITLTPADAETKAKIRRLVRHK